MQCLLDILVLKSVFYLLHEHTIVGFHRQREKEIELEIFLIGGTYVVLPVLLVSLLHEFFTNYLFESIWWCFLNTVLYWTSYLYHVSEPVLTLLQLGFYYSTLYVSQCECLTVLFS